MTTQELCQAFLDDKRFLLGVSPTTAKWYEHGFRTFGIFEWTHSFPLGPTELQLDRERTLYRQLTERMVELGLKGHRITTINSYAVAVNAFLTWATTEKYLRSSIRLTPLVAGVRRKVEVFPLASAKRIIRFVPKTFTEARIRLCALLALDCGISLEEALRLKKQDVRLEDSLLIIRKNEFDGGRVVPVSPIMNPLLRQYERTIGRHVEPFLFGGSTYRKSHSIRNGVRDFHRLLKKCSIELCSWGSLQRAYECAYVRHGGDLKTLQRRMGHQSIKTTKSHVAKVKGVKLDRGVGQPEGNGSCVVEVLNSFKTPSGRRRIESSVKILIFPSLSTKGDYDNCQCFTCRELTD